MSFFGGRRQTENDTQPEVAKPPTPGLSKHPIGFETILGANCSIEGSLSSQGNVRLDGEFSGTLEISGNVLVGETAKITADVHARNISIAGAVRGNVSGKKVQLLRTGRIWGDISATALTTEEGAFIDGKIAMVSPEVARGEIEQTETIETFESMADDDEIETIDAELVDDEPEPLIEDDALEVSEPADD